MYIPFEQLSESKEWKVGETYRVKLVLKQTSLDENGANFEIIDANSMEPSDVHKSNVLLSEEGMYFGK